MQQLTQSEKIHLGIKEITRRIREQIKQEFKNCVFSVTKESYSGGASIHINLMKAGFKVVKDFSEIPESVIIRYLDNGMRTREQLKEFQEKKHYQLGNFTCREEYDSGLWNNGVFLTEKGFKLFKRVQEITNEYNYNHSDSMTDYFDVNFYLDLGIGRYDTPFIQEVD